MKMERDCDFDEFVRAAEVEKRLKWRGNGAVIMMAL